MAPNSRIAELASLIQHHTLKVEDYISSQGLPSPSFDIGTPAQLQFPEAIAESQNKVIEATDELHSLMLGPIGFLFHQIDSPVWEPDNSATIADGPAQSNQSSCYQSFCYSLVFSNRRGDNVRTDSSETSAG